MSEDHSQGLTFKGLAEDTMNYSETSSCTKTANELQITIPKWLVTHLLQALYLQ